MLKLKFTWNLALFDVMNSGFETLIFDSKEMYGILDIRLMDYYKINKEYYNRILGNIIDLNQLKPYVNNLTSL